MKNFLFSAISIVACATCVAGVACVAGVESVCSTPANISTDHQWKCGSIYEISFLDGCPRINDKEVLLSAPLMEAINSIRTDDNTAYGDYAIEYSYIEAEDLYIANIIDEFAEL